jgi:hypothetical protein
VFIEQLRHCLVTGTPLRYEHVSQLKNIKGYLLRQSRFSTLLENLLLVSGQVALYFGIPDRFYIHRTDTDVELAYKGEAKR